MRAHYKQNCDQLTFWSIVYLCSNGFRILLKIVFLFVILESTLLVASDEKKSILWEAELVDFDQDYSFQVDRLLKAFESERGIALKPSVIGKVGLKLDTRAGAGLSTPKGLIKGVIQALELRGFLREQIFLVDYSMHQLKEADFYELNGQMAQFEGCPVYALDAFEFFDELWFYDNPVPPISKQGLVEAMGDRPKWLKKNSDFDARKSYLPMPLMFGCDFWINLAVCMDDPILGLDGALANASIWNVSNQWRFLLDSSTASVAVAEILAIPEVNERLILSILSLESYQFIGGPDFNALYSRSLPIVWMSDDPVAIDRYCLNLVNKERRKNGFDELSTRNLQLLYASNLGLGFFDLQWIEKRQLKKD